MSASPFSLGGGGGSGGAEQDADRDEQRDQGDNSGSDTLVGTTGQIRATTENVQTGLSGQSQMGDPSTTSVALGSGSTATVDETSGQGTTEGRLTVTNQSDGGTTVSVDRGSEQPATTVKKRGGDGVRVDQLDAVQQQSQTAPSGPSDSGPSSGSSSGGDGVTSSVLGDRTQLPPVLSGMGGGGSGSGLFTPQSGGGGLMDTLTSPVGLVLAAVAVGAVVYGTQNDGNDGNGQNGGQSDG